MLHQNNTQKSRGNNSIRYDGMKASGDSVYYRNEKSLSSHVAKNKKKQKKTLVFDCLENKSFMHKNRLEGCLLIN